MFRAVTLAVWVLFALVTAGCGMKPVQHAGVGHSGWIEVTTPNFRIRTSLAEAPALELAKYLETTRASMLQAAWGGSAGPARRIQVVVFARSTTFNSVVPFWQGETYSPGGHERIIVFPGDTNVPTVAAHELAHVISSYYMPVQPSWLAEGVASYLETIRFGARSQQAYVGAPPSSRVESMKQLRSFDTQAMFAAESARASGISEVSGFYAQSWLLVHFLITEHPEEFAQFQRQVAKLTDWHDAYRFAMPASLDAGPSLDKALSQYWENRGNWVFAATKPVVILDYKPEVRALPPAAVHGLYSWLLPSDSPRMQEEANEALRLDPAQLDAIRTLSLRGNASKEQRRAWAERAVQAHPNDAEAWVLFALSPTSGKEQKESLDHAALLDPENPQVQLLRALLLDANGRSKEALHDLRMALRTLVPSRTLVIAYVASLAANRKCIEAKQVSDTWAAQLTSEEKGALRGALEKSCGSEGRKAEASPAH